MTVSLRHRLVMAVEWPRPGGWNLRATENAKKLRGKKGEKAKERERR